MTLARKLSSTAAALVLMAGVASVTPPADAATAARMTLNPATKTVTKGTVVPLVVKVNTGTHAVNAVQFYITLPSNLRCADIVLIADAWPNQAAKDCTGGQTAAFAVSGPAFTGIARVAKIKIKTPGTGTSTVAFDRTRTMVVDANTNTDVLGSTNQAVITVNP
jgi:hypothetical protein